MSEESFAQMLDNEEWKEIRTGEVVDGRVIAVKPDRIVLNIGGKSDGIITVQSIHQLLMWILLL